MIAGLPYDAEVEYLQSTGAQYIDTGVSACNAVVGTDIRFQSTSTQNNEWVFGTYSGSLGNNYNYLVGSLSGWCVGLYDNTFYRPGTPVDTGVHRVRINIDGKTRFDDVVLLDGIVSKTYEGDRNTSLWMFMTHRTGSSPMNGYYLTAKVFYCKVYLDGVLVRDLIPVRFTNEQNQSEGAMYDRVSRKLFRNAGTGSFTIGPDVATPVMGLHFMPKPKLSARNYVQDGLIAMWDGIENAGWGVHDQNATTWVDLSGNNNDCTLSEWATWTASGIVCDGTHYMAQAPANGISDTWQCEVVLNRTLTTYGYLCYLASKINGSSTNAQQLMLAFRENALMMNNGVSPINGQFVTTRWSGIPLVCSIAADFMHGRLYVNANEAAISSGTENWSTVTLGEIGGRIGRIGNVFKGEIKTIRLYSRALTADEFAHNFAVDKERFNLP